MEPRKWGGMHTRSLQFDTDFFQELVFRPCARKTNQGASLLDPFCERCPLSPRERQPVKNYTIRLEETGLADPFQGWHIDRHPIPKHRDANAHMPCDDLL